MSLLENIGEVLVYLAEHEIQNSTLLLKVMSVFIQTFCKLDIFLIVSFGVINMDLLSVKVVLQENLHVFN